MANEPVNLKGSKVLIVDDMPANLDLLSQILEQEDYQVSFATSGEQAIKVATLDLPDLILLDIMMPGMDGFETCRRLKSISATQRIPVIFVTGRTDSQDVLEGFHIGAVDYITKPVRQEEVCARVRTHLAKEVLIRIRDELIEKLRRHNDRNQELLQMQQEQLRDAAKLALIGERVAELTHEVNTPLGVSITALSSLSELVIRTRQVIEAGHLTRSGLQDFLATTEESAGIALANLQRAKALVESFKRVTVDQCTEESARFKLREYLEQLLLTLSPKLKKTRIDVCLECAPDIELESYPGALSQIVTNLISNSLLHGFDKDEAGTIRIQAQEEGEALTLCYSDDGCGIGSDQLERIFEKYFTTKRAVGSSGLGLHILHTLVTETLKGTVSVSSEKGKGVAFRIRFPREL